MNEQEIAVKTISYVGEFILGGIAIFAVLLAGWTIREKNKVHAQHVKDLRDSADKLMTHSLGYKEASAATIAALDRLNTSESNQTSAIKDLTTAVQEMRSDHSKTVTQCDSSYGSVARLAESLGAEIKDQRVEQGKHVSKQLESMAALRSSISTLTSSVDGVIREAVKKSG